MKKYTFVILLCVLLTGCEKNLSNEPKTDLTFYQLPDTIKTIFEQSTKPHFLDSLNADWTPETYAIINLDYDIKKAEYEVEKTGPWIDEYKFIIDGHIWTMAFNNSHETNDPYILFNKELYFVKTVNLSKQGLTDAEFGKFNLEQTLK